MMKKSLALTLLSAYASAYYSGSIGTRERFRYGKFKTRIQGAAQKGTVTSFFTFWQGEPGLPWSSSRWEEIDIEIVPSVEENPFFTNLIYAYHQMDGAYHPNFDPGTEYHDYEIVWKPDYIAWSLDGVEVRR